MIAKDLRELISAIVQFTVGNLVISNHNSDRVRVVHGHLIKLLVNESISVESMLSIVPSSNDGSTLSFSQNIQAANGQAHRRCLTDLQQGGGELSHETAHFELRIVGHRVHAMDVHGLVRKDIQLQGQREVGLALNVFLDESSRPIWISREIFENQQCLEETSALVDRGGILNDIKRSPFDHGRLELLRLEAL